MRYPYPRKPWPFSVLLAGMAIFGVVSGALRIGLAAQIMLGVIAMAMGLGRP